MGATHAVSGLVLYTVVAPWVASSASEVAVGLVCCAAASVLPDIDHPGSTVSRLAGPVTGLLSRVVAVGAGGHRAGTHSLLGVAVAGILTWVAVRAGGVLAVGCVTVLLLVGAAALGSRLPARALRAVGVAVVAAAVAAAGVAVGALDVPVAAVVVTDVSQALEGVRVGLGGVQLDPAPIAIAVALGWFAHCLGDAITHSGVPWLWPVDRDAVRLPLTIRTGGLVERVVIHPACVLAVLLVGWHNGTADVLADSLTGLVGTVPSSTALPSTVLPGTELSVTAESSAAATATSGTSSPSPSAALGGLNPAGAP